MQDQPGRVSLFRLPRAARVAIYLPIISLIFVFGLRRLEHALTHHPVRYDASAQWTVPPNGEDVWINVTNEQRIHGWFLNARSQPALATILLCHGNGGNLTNVNWYGQEFAEHGFDVLLIDYRGYGRSDGNPTDEWALNADGEAAYNYLLSRRGVKPEKLILHGASLGTTVAIDVASRKPCGALVVESGLSSASEMGEHSLPFLPRFLHVLAKNKFESVRKIADVHCPVLITHGTNDTTIPVAQGRNLFAAANEPKRLRIIEGGSHNLAGEGGEAYLVQIVSFLREAMSGKLN
jgi:pimeloyl-ACP methyl ester carboxylesterase